MQTEENEGIDAYRAGTLEASARGLTLANIPALEAASNFQQALQKVEAIGPALVGPVFSNAYKEAMNQQLKEVAALEASQPETTEDNKKPTKKKEELKYLSVTGYFNRAYKRQLAWKIEKNKRREVKMLVCSICRQSYTGDRQRRYNPNGKRVDNILVNRCQCPVQKPARKDINV